MANRPPSGCMVYWRFRGDKPSAYRFGYVTYEEAYSLVRMGRWNGDSAGGQVVDVNEIEWRRYDDN